MQNEIKAKSKLLDKNGNLFQAGWAKGLILDYNRDDIKAPKYKIKEWDYYCILSEKAGAAFTIADNGYLGFVSVTLLDFETPAEFSNSIITPFPMGSFNLPATSEIGNTVFENDKISLKFIKENEIRTIAVSFHNFYDKKILEGTIVLHQPDMLETMVIATPFPKNKKAFYYNQKINCMTAEGKLKHGDKEIIFEKENSFGVLDWGRGVWTYSNTWYWGSASGKIDNNLFGFNIGYGFGDTSKATENMLFYNGKAHKIDSVKFHIPKDDYLKPWQFTSNDSRFEMRFAPIIDRHSNTNLLLLQSKQHQVFGKFTGRVILDDNKEILVKDFPGFAEKVKNRW